jgi:hypothetical protein
MCGNGRGGAGIYLSDKVLDTVEQGDAMGSQTTTVLYVVLMAAVIVAVDVLFFRNRFWERLTVNIGIVLIFGAFYFRFLKRP